MKRGETGHRTGSFLTPLDMICLLCRFLSLYFFSPFYLFNAQAVFITSLQGGSASLQQNKCGLCFCQRGRGLVLDLRSHSALRGSHCLGPLFVQGLQREKGPARGEGGRRARVWKGAVGAHLQHHTLTSTPFSLNRPPNLMFIMCTSHTDGEDSALDRKVRILYMQLKYLTHWHILSICGARDKEAGQPWVIIFFSWRAGKQKRFLGYKWLFDSKLSPLDDQNQLPAVNHRETTGIYWGSLLVSLPLVKIICVQAANYWSCSVPSMWNCLLGLASVFLICMSFICHRYQKWISDHYKYYRM